MSPAAPVPDYRQVFHAAPAPLLLLTPSLTIVAANQAWLESTATTPEATAGRDLFEVFPGSPAGRSPDGPVALRKSLERVRDTGRPDSIPLQRYDLPMPDGSYAERFWSCRTVPILDGDDVVLLLHRADDMTDYVRYRDDGRPGTDGPPDADRVQRAEADLFARTQELEQANAELLASSERERRTASTLAGLATTVSALSAAESRADLLRLMFRHGLRALGADLLAVALLEPGGGHLAVVDTHGSPAPEPVQQLSVHSPLPMAAAAAGRPLFEEDADRGEAAGPALPGLRAWAALPLRIGTRPLGSVTVGWEHPHPFADDDVRVLEAFAAQCSQAMNRVARRETERRQASATRSLAETLQRSLLTDPPQPEHLDIAVRYRPAAREAQIGGDWYDAFVSPAGDTTVVIGDVTGHDWTAAAIAGQLRNMLRGIASALDHRDPERVLGALDRALRETGTATLASAVVARIEEAPDRGHLLRWSNAGHPAPLLLAPDGTASLLERPADLLLGVAPETRRRQHDLPLTPGATVVLYTDGLVERRDAGLDVGLDRLLAAAPGLTDLPVDEVCDELLLRLAPDLTDDIALLAVRVRDDG